MLPVYLSRYACIIPALVSSGIKSRWCSLPAASVNLHRFSPHLLDIGYGSSFILQKVNLGLHREHHDGDKAAIAGTVKGKKIKSIGSAAKHTLTRAVCRVGFIGYLVNLFLPA